MSDTKQIKSFIVRYYYLATGMEGNADERVIGTFQCETGDKAIELAIAQEFPEGDVMYGPNNTWSSIQFFRGCLRAEEDYSEILDSWSQLDKDHKLFVLRVRDGGGWKHAAEPHTIDSKERYEPPNDQFFMPICLWEKAEDSGFIKCVGSYKWVVTEKYAEIERLLLGVEG